MIPPAVSGSYFMSALTSLDSSAGIARRTFSAICGGQFGDEIGGIIRCKKGYICRDGFGWNILEERFADRRIKFQEDSASDFRTEKVEHELPVHRRQACSRLSAISAACRSAIILSRSGPALSRTSSRISCMSSSSTSSVFTPACGNNDRVFGYNSLVLYRVHPESCYYALNVLGQRHKFFYCEFLRPLFKRNRRCRGKIF